MMFVEQMKQSGLTQRLTRLSAPLTKLGIRLFLMKESLLLKLWEENGISRFGSWHMCGAEVILIPERPMSLADIVKLMDDNAKKGKRAGIIVAAEGCGSTSKLALEMQQQTESEVRLSILGYAQRGGSPTTRSRLLASLFAEKAVDLICQGQGNMAVGWQNGTIMGFDLDNAANGTKSIDLRLLQVADMLAT